MVCVTNFKHSEHIDHYSYSKTYGKGRKVAGNDTTSMVKLRASVVELLRLLASNHLPLIAVGSNPARDFGSYS
jgi:hypothetical protein